MPAAVQKLQADQCVVLDGISCELYRQLRTEADDGHRRFTYDQSTLEIMSPAPLHEMMKTVTARLIEAYADAAGVVVDGLGSTTFSDKDLAIAFEPDECYYAAHADVLIGKDEIDLSIDPPPDLAIEIDISPPDVGRQPIYAAMGVPQVWRLNGREFQFLNRTSDAAYQRANVSHVLPKLSL